MVWLRRIGFFFALGFLILTFVNASWLADSPKGYVRLLASRGVIQQPAVLPLKEGQCPAQAIETPVHDFLENTLPALQQASGFGAGMVQVDVQMTQDGQLVLLRDKTLDCRTNGKGEVRAATLAQLKALDAGYGYSADGGKTFPLRGKGVGYIPTIDDTLAAMPTEPLLFNLTGQEPAVAAKLAEALAASGRAVEKIGDGFIADEKALAPIRARFPKAWAFSMEGARQCTSDYKLQGWLGMTPASCKNGTLLVAMNRQILFAGWPDRLQARMAAVGARVIMTGADSGSGEPRGLDLPEQIREVPASFTGYVLVDDIWVVGPARQAKADRRNGREIEETEALLVKRRENR